MENEVIKNDKQFQIKLFFDEQGKDIQEVFEDAMLAYYDKYSRAYLKTWFFFKECVTLNFDNNIFYKI